MKKLLFIPVLFLTFYCKAQYIKAIIGKPIKIGNLFIAQNDFPKEMNWDDAEARCAKLGIGWRLPTKDELNTLYENKQKISGFEGSYHWSSTEGNSSKYAWSQGINNGYQETTPKGNNLFVRAVSDLYLSYHKSTQVGNEFQVVGKSVKIGNLLVAQYDFDQPIDWIEANKACKALGSGWRLPTKDELKTLYENKEKIGGFTNHGYWSSTENSVTLAWAEKFGDGLEFGSGLYGKGNEFYVRAVRAF